MTQFRIRLPQAHDWPALRQLFLESRIAAFHWTDIRRFQLQDLDAQTSDEDILLAEDARGQLAGFISVQSESRFIHHLYVAATHQRLGIGAALLQQLPQWQQEPWQLKCLQLNQPAVNFYMAQGFSVMESGDCDDGAYWLMQLPTN
ncbi:GNAT family N-acetyltransferase [Undibacterium luofuense]|uniref:GNAT family N-acetyltransferase n=1 Tax=Undibacterium luofuense TaxID=2828733 RepID=A0A941DIC9_9BURK|nr:GNAT family N-acetyltransferase [Undibacterium luofuense]MBR7781293.1 GNAT family N-acetyltransferase [Undibacterium luofuense]